jgi:hypothetical protein
MRRTKRMNLGRLPSGISQQIMVVWREQQSGISCLVRSRGSNHLKIKTAVMERSIRHVILAVIREPLRGPRDDTIK